MLRLLLLMDQAKILLVNDSMPLRRPKPLAVFSVALVGAILCST